jgi:hypothetical protein
MRAGPRLLVAACAASIAASPAAAAAPPAASITLGLTSPLTVRGTHFAAHERIRIPKQLDPLGDRFRPYRSIAARYCSAAVPLLRPGSTEPALP